MELVLRRTTIAPGGGLPPHSHPGSIVIVVDAGTWGYTPLGGTIQLTRAAVDGTLVLWLLPQDVAEGIRGELG